MRGTFAAAGLIRVKGQGFIGGGMTILCDCKFFESGNGTLGFSTFADTRVKAHFVECINQEWLEEEVHVYDLEVAPECTYLLVVERSAKKGTSTFRYFQRNRKGLMEQAPPPEAVLKRYAEQLSNFEHGLLGKVEWRAPIVKFNRDANACEEI